MKIRHTVLLLSIMASVSALAADTLPQSGRIIPQRINRIPATAENSGNTLLSATLTYGDSITPLSIGAMGAGKTKTQRTLTAGMKSASLQLAAGTYDVWVEFCRYQPDLPADQQIDFYNPHYYVILENVTVGDSGTQITIDASTATRHVAFQPLTPQGERFKYYVLRYKPDGSAYLDKADANINNEAIGVCISHSEYGNLSASYVLGAHANEKGGSASESCDLYVNNISDKYSFSQTRLALDTANNLYIVMLSGKGIPSCPISNTAESYTVFEEKFQVSPLYDSFRREQYNSGIDIDAYINGLYMFKLKHESADMYPKVHIARNTAMSPDTEPHFTMYPRLYEMNMTVGDNLRRLVMGDVATDVTKTGIVYSHPTHPHFTFSADNKEGLMGANVPVTKMIMHAVDAGSKYKILYRPEFYGRFSERRESDSQTLEALICHNGTPVCTSWQGLDDWAAQWAADGHTPGVMTARFINRNVTVDNMRGASTLEITYDENNNDQCAPAIQHLSFSSTDGRITDRFKDGETVKVQFAAGDANGNGSRFSYMDAASAKVEYAPHGTDSFTEAATTVIRNATSTQCWTVYGASIGNVPESSNKWYDLRVTLCDQAGNRSVQTLSPAFRVDGTGGCDVATDTHRTVRIPGNRLCLEGYEGLPAVEVFNVSGTKVYSFRGLDADIPHLDAGLYIVRINGTESYRILKQ